MLHVQVDIFCVRGIFGNSEKYNECNRLVASQNWRLTVTERRAIRTQTRGNEEAVGYVPLLFADGLHDDCSLSGVDIGFHEN
jgi:hypothetical protein